MLLRTLILLILPLAISAVDPVECAEACQTPMTYVQFTGSPTSADYYASSCTNLLLVQSTFLCMRYYCPEDGITAGLASLDKTCQTYGAVELLPWSIISNISTEQLLAWPHIEYADLGGVDAYDTPIFLNDSLFELSLRTIVTWDDSLTARANYGYALFGFFAIVVFIAMVSRAVNFIADRRRRHATKASPGIFRAVGAVMKTHVTLPALFSHQTAEPGVCGIIPARLPSLTIFAFAVINLVLCCVRYNTFEQNLYWANPKLQIWRYVSDRTGVISMANLPLIWAFAMRNNVLIWLTGWDFATCNTFHRWVARIATIEAIVHSIGYTVFSFYDGGKLEYDLDWAEQYWWMGGIATIVMSLLCVFSIYSVRRYAYELFLLVHISFAILFLISMYYHVYIFAGEYNVFIWPCVAVWSFDRFLRLASLVALNFPTFKATATHNPEANIIRLTVPTRKLLRPRPGTYYYVYMLHGFKPWESHPFTLKSWQSKEHGSNSKRCDELEFMLRPYGGFTSRLLEHIQRDSNTNSPTPLRMAIEGPYGTPCDITKHSSILFIIGGSGITVALSHLQALHEALQEAKQVSEPTRVHSIRLVWAVRDVAMFEDIQQRELLEWCTSSQFLSRVSFRVDVHVTGAEKPVLVSHELPGSKELELGYTAPLDLKDVEPVTPPSPEAVDDSKSSDPTSPAVGNVQILHHRPAVGDLIVECAKEWDATNEKMAVVCCGPGTMVDDARAAVVSAVGDGYDQIEFLPEMFYW